MNYQEFLSTKLLRHETNGFDVELNDLNQALFDWQRVVVRWALSKGKAALFESCGLGKTAQQLVWADMICRMTEKNVLILAPLAVSIQTKREGLKFGISVNVCRSQNDVIPGVNITNYEMLDKFNPEKFIGIVLDESSILKSFMGKTKTALISAFKNTPYKLLATATPAPNDYLEILNQSDFLGIMPSNEAISRWFINDTMNFGSYRLKKHATKDFWRWVSSWAVCLDKPSDIGYDDNGFVLPELITHEHLVKYDYRDVENGNLFKDLKPSSATDLYKNLRETAKDRTDLAAFLINASKETWVVWCHTNDESKMLTKKINDSSEIVGSMSIEKKEKILNEFLDGNLKVLITKPSICGFGLNLQICHNMAFVGLNYSFEQRYQAIRRCWRFGQTRPVNDHVILSPVESHVFKTIKQKEKKHLEMSGQMLFDARDYNECKKKDLSLMTTYDEKLTQGKGWELYRGDCVQEIKKIQSDIVGFSIFSPPFSNLYIYSESLMDMGNCKDDSEFFNHFKFLIPEIYRITMPGRLCAVHCKDLVDYKNRDGEAGLRDFPGKIIQEFEKAGWKYHSRVTIWKDPVIEMQRTKAQGLLHASCKRDSSVARQGLPDYLLVFRKWPSSGETSGPEPITRKKGFEYYIGENAPDVVKKSEEDEFYSICVWQRYASPVWFDIKQTNVLNCSLARENEDEKHICPLQLDVIERSIHLWSNENDIVFSPFAGIGSEGYQALKMNRRFIGIELKESYYKHAVNYLESISDRPKQMTLFG